MDMQNIRLFIHYFCVKSQADSLLRKTEKDSIIDAGSRKKAEMGKDALHRRR